MFQQKIMIQNCDDLFNNKTHLLMKTIHKDFMRSVLKVEYLMISESVNTFWLFLAVIDHLLVRKEAENLRHGIICIADDVSLMDHQGPLTVVWVCTTIRPSQVLIWLEGKRVLKKKNAPDPGNSSQVWCIAIGVSKDSSAQINAQENSKVNQQTDKYIIFLEDDITDKKLNAKFKKLLLKSLFKWRRKICRFLTDC